MKNTSFTGSNLGSGLNHRNYNDNSSLITPQSPKVLNRRNNYFSHIPAVQRIVSRVKAYFIVRGVKSALKEVDLIESGAKNPKSLDQLLNEL
jgi:hypothetical protein